MSEEEDGPEYRIGDRCLYFTCGERYNWEMEYTKYWEVWGCCSREHSVLHYGEDIYYDV